MADFQIPTARRDEDIALDLMKFIAATTSFGKATGASAGFQGGSSSKAEDEAQQLLNLYTKCLSTVRQK